ncbi:MAG: sigma-54 dependent transcriptional regulator [bacterium]|nr:sigma-54 dependent transcriptional regulator [bacterium]
MPNNLPEFEIAAGLLKLPPPLILVIDDEASMREFLEILLVRQGYQVKLAANGLEALEHCHRFHFDLVITDLKLPGLDGIEITRKIQKIAPGTQVMVITAFGSTESAVEAMKSGACDYLEKPFQVEEVKLRIANNLSRLKLEQENLLLRRELKTRLGFGALIGNAPVMLRVFGLIRQVADTQSNVLIVGESGTGKELVARAIHFSGSRRNAPFVPVDCSAIPETLIESELFGHEKGAFTGAVRTKPGLFEVSSGGTIFLDEITELPSPMQVKLLRAIQEHKIRRVGGTKEIEADLRILAATNRDIDEMVETGKFREDLFYRLNVIRLELPPLRERQEDIPILVEHFRGLLAQKSQKTIPIIPAESLELLKEYPFPGNVRELENLVERVVALASSDRILPEDIYPHLNPNFPPEISEPVVFPPEGINLESQLEAFERKMIRAALEKSGGKKKKAAGLLGLSFRSFRYKLEKYGIGSENSGEDQES